MAIKKIKSTHPLWEGWKSTLRVARRSGGHDPRWSDFWEFVADVGRRPRGARLYRIDRSKPYQKDNVEWRKSVSSVSQLQDKARYMRDWHAKRPRKSKSLYLQRGYGITIEQYEAMLAAQNNVCAICEDGETVIDSRNGRPFKLAVDHCHTAQKRGKMKIRGLLCIDCNRGLGRFKDDPALLRAAIAYLERHAVA